MRLTSGVDDPAELPGVLQEASREGLQDLGREKFDELRPMDGDRVGEAAVQDDQGRGALRVIIAKLIPAAPAELWATGTIFPTSPRCLRARAEAPHSVN